MADVEYEVKDRIAYVTLNRPDKMNAISFEMFEELVAAYKIFSNDRDAWVAIVSGKGRAFCTGLDLASQRPDQGGIGVDQVYLEILEIKKPLIAAVHGYCLAQGAGIAFCSDIRIAAEGTKFGWPQVKIGTTSISGPSLLAHFLPINYAYQYLFTGDFFDAQRAMDFRLVNQVVPQEELLSAAEGIAGKILENAPLAIQGMKEGIQMGLEMPLAERMRCARQIQKRIEQTEDFEEGKRAFAEKRKPVWKGT